MPPRQLAEDDPEANSQYPIALFEQATSGETWTSPTKDVKRYHRALKRRKRSQGDDLPNTDEHLSEIPTHDVDFGSWDPSTDPIDSSAPLVSAVSVSTAPTDPLPAFIEAVETFGAGWYCITDSLFVVQGWDSRRAEPTNNWYHLQHLEIDGKVHSACTCPAASQDPLCIHQQFFNLYDVETLLSMTPIIEVPGEASANVAIYSRQPVPNSPDFVTMFSVQGISTSELKGRAIVSHTGAKPSGGMWKCSKHSTGELCVHVKQSFELFQAAIGEDGRELDPARFAITRSLASLTRLESVSYRAILPPVSLSLKDDPALYPRPPPFRNPPSSVLTLEHGGSCPCADGRSIYDPSLPIIEKACRIFTLLAVHDGTLQVQPCPKCPSNRRRFIGPDLREQGLFNYNNSILVSHELLDEYTFTFVTSETPFNAFVATVNHRYTVSGAEFMGDDLFRSIWFAYATRLAMDNDMRCTRCGVNPETVIWDGITLAFGRKHLSSTLSPPTQTSASSIKRLNIRNHPRQQLILDSALRKLIRQVVNAPRPELEEEEAEDEEAIVGDAVQGAPSNAAQMELDRRSRLKTEHLGRVNAVYDGLQKECSSLAAFFFEMYGPAAYSQRKAVPSSTSRFFLQIAAEESVLQMINGVALTDLCDFLGNPQPQHLTKILSIPGLYRVLKNQSTIHSFIPLLFWLANRAYAVLQQLSVETAPLSHRTDTVVAQSDWKVVSTLSSVVSFNSDATMRPDATTVFLKYESVQSIPS
ncbi:hypothetical protein H1R20_g9042, partial [Candolleomyces eurysporus]